MQQHLLPEDTRAEVFDTVADADRAIRGLLAAGFTKEQITVICPEKFKGQCALVKPEPQGQAGAAENMAKGGAAGLALGGLALAAAALTGGLTLPGAIFLFGGSAFVGGFSNLIVSKGYDVEPHDSIKQALKEGKIIVGVDTLGDNAAERLERAQRILEHAGGRQPQVL